MDVLLVGSAFWTDCHSLPPVAASACMSQHAKQKFSKEHCVEMECISVRSPMFIVRSGCKDRCVFCSAPTQYQSHISEGLWAGMRWRHHSTVPSPREWSGWWISTTCLYG